MTSLRYVVLCTFLVLTAREATGQIVESVGGRALGMGGAFVAVANDSSATWWNPAGLAAGPFLDLAIGRALTSQDERLPARQDRSSWFALGTPVLGFSVYRLRIIDIRPVDPTGGTGATREETQGVPTRSWSATQIGGTLMHTLTDGVHVGATVKYLRGTVRYGREDPQLAVDDLIERAGDLEGGDAENRVDLDVGLLATAGALRLGATVRNLSEPGFGDGDLVLPRQFRVGAAVDMEATGGPPLLIAFDADVRRYGTGNGERRVLAVGAEQWFKARRFGVRAGARFNQVGAEERSATAGVSVALRSGLYLDGHVVRGGSPEEKGWGVASRVSF